jgi:precorrin-6A/cobalt-precorrin-6A reductase
VRCGRYQSPSAVGTVAAVPDKPVVLVLGGTTEASALVPLLLARHPQVDVVTSFAGRTQHPRSVGGRVRVGGFGGVDGLVGHLRDEGVHAVVDATHPFAAQMPWHAAEACTQVGVPRLRLLRPGWSPVPGDRWFEVPDLPAAASALATMGARRVLLTTGRQQLAPFAELRDTWFLVRAIEQPEPQPLVQADVLLARGPFDLDGERRLLEDRRIDAVVTKNSGGIATAAKLHAARALRLPVVVVARPPAPDGPTVVDAEAAATWVATTLGPQRS